MSKFAARLKALEHKGSTGQADPHSDCLALWQARVSAASLWEQWQPDTVLPDERPDDGVLYPRFECFHGDAADCTHHEWADKSYARDRHIPELLSFTEEDLGEVGPPISLEAQQRQREGLLQLRAKMTKDLDRLEKKLMAS